MKRRDVVVIAASSGAFHVLRTLVARLPADLPAIISIVVHIGRHASRLPELLSCWGPLPACHASHGDVPQPGHIYLAPPDRHLLMNKGRFQLSGAAAENFARPAADPLFRSAAMQYGERVVGVVLSGDLDDGAAGLAMVRAHGGYGIVQDPADCEVSSMPRAALKAAGADAIALADALADAIVAAVQGAPRIAPDPDDIDHAALRTEAQIASGERVGLDELDGIAVRSALTCPDCGGVLWRLRDIHPPRYRCHTGHAYSIRSLDEAIVQRTEQSIWMAIRAVNECVVLARERRQSATRAGDATAASAEDLRINDAQALSDLLRAAVERAGALRGREAE
ncbi:chemotaxis protein CheB [Paraburkholderia rhizosphaerae]|uniref:protein-glutamate methylesterase n=1 Tax=Paraburkholderia rhizosphaerae TaxID=480658 RepID=A0A4R8LJB9_9BURK|nr:chemotaxis protein CheB [Paraburkholderia rhizosphaerae]TDY43895.1 two-component system chemotaxis response regulator CheB [Paraburkholderia rhizosphaerae]